MSKKRLFFTKAVIIASLALAIVFWGTQSFGYEWEKTFGGSSNDQGFSVQQTTDGGYIIAGDTESFGAGESDVYLIKTDADGDSVWDKTFGGSRYDYGSSVQQTTDGGYIIAGTKAADADADVYLIKTDADGNKHWDKTFGGSYYDIGISVQQTADDGYIIAGGTTSFGAGKSDVYLIKTDADGNKQWDKTFGGSWDDSGRSVQQTTDGGYIIAGYTIPFPTGGCDVYLVKTDDSGNKLWEKTFGGSQWVEGSSVQQTTDGGYIIAGYTDTFEPLSDSYLVKTDADGNMLWEKTFDGSRGLSVQQTTDGGYIIAGSTKDSEEDDSDVYLLKTDADGNILWEKSFGGSGNDGGRSVKQTTDGGYIIAGDTNSFGAGGWDVYLIYYYKEAPTITVTSPNGGETWQRGTTHSITWTSVDVSGNVKIELYRGGILDSTISSSTANDGSYSWSIPAGQAPGSDYRIKISSTSDPSINDYSDDYFTIEAWQTAYDTLFDSPSEVELLRQYRDEVLSKTAKGSEYEDLLYKSSEEALEVLVDNPELMAQAKDLIYANMVAVDDVLHGQEGIIYNTDEIAAFLDAYAKEAPPALKTLAKMVKWHMLSNQRKGKLFFGFWLE